MSRGVHRFTVRDLMMCAAMAALGIAIKQIVGPLIKIISAPLMIPGGTMAGGIYMMWLVMAFGLTDRRGAATLTGLIQAVIVMISGMYGSHGVMSLISYTMPGVAIDVGLLLAWTKIRGPLSAMAAGMLANMAGSICTNFIFFRLPLIPLLLSLSVAAFSGAVGGLLAWLLLKSLRKYGIV